MGKSQGREEERYATRIAGHNMFELGQESERQDWTEAGHRDYCLAAPGHITSDGSSQTDLMHSPPSGWKQAVSDCQVALSALGP